MSLNTQNTNQETKQGSITLSAGIGDAHVDTAYAASDLVEATRNVAEAKTNSI